MRWEEEEEEEEEEVEEEVEEEEEEEEEVAEEEVEETKVNLYSRLRCSVSGCLSVWLAELTNEGPSHSVIENTAIQHS